MNPPSISLICSTIGRPEELQRQLAALGSGESAAQVEFVLVDQSDDQQCAQVLAEYPSKGTWKSTTSGRGVSVGRNVGIALATAPVLAFPDDNCWYAPDTVRKVLTLMEQRPDVDGVSGKQVTADGRPSMLRWLDREVLVSRTNFMRTTISSTIFLRRSSLPSAAPFDEGIGVGSPGCRGSGEESDLLLRLLAAGGKVLYRPDIHIYQDDDRRAPTDEFVDKMWKYGVGIGHLWRRHRLPVTQLAYHCARKLVGSAIRTARGERIRARADRAYLRGQLAGWRGIAP